MHVWHSRSSSYRYCYRPTRHMRCARYLRLGALCALCVSYARDGQLCRTIVLHREFIKGGLVKGG